MESQTMRIQDRCEQSYNDQALMNCYSQVIVEKDVTTDANDKQQLEPMLDECADMNGQLLADAGYWSEAIVELKDDKTELVIATTKDWKRRKKLREEGPLRGPVPDSAGPKKLMERK